MSRLQDRSKMESRKALDILTRERAMALSQREWKHRLAGYGYRLKETDRGLVVMSALAGHEICAVPDRLQ